MTTLDYSVPPTVPPVDEILPDEPLLLMGAGPVPVQSRVAAANSMVINHLGSAMSQVVTQVKLLAQYVFQTNSPYVFGVSGPGSAAMEMAITNVVWPGRKVLSIKNGYFSSRFEEMASRVGGENTILEASLNHYIEAEAVEAELKKNQYDVLTIVQGETSNTVFNRQLPEIAALAKKYGVLCVVDAVCTLSTMPLCMDKWGIDVVVTGGQKGLSSVPGVSLIAFSEKAWETIQKREARMSHWCFDTRLAYEFWHNKGYHYTAPVSGLLALHEALRLICIETLPVRFERHLRCSNALQHAIEAMGLGLFVEPQSRLNSVIGINLPESINAEALLARMSERYLVEISGSFGGHIVRIGQMGEQCRSHHLLRVLHALGMSLQSMGAGIDVPAGMAELEKQLLVTTKN
ncbi:alanine--glyoxylate aminotransferase [Gammaproteobacteria bacterium 45_16_T64]|nr:alanine--glyoxylate aminotransferase [Gammaproteobacteria bacterium 45_16_T64]